MRFADKRYYIEAYVKCANCGVLVYEEDTQAAAASRGGTVYCSDWCRDWAASHAKRSKRPTEKTVAKPGAKRVPRRR